MSLAAGSERRATSTPAEPESIKCPRCDSTNTKFCYYNNYNLSQPRHLCKSCRRYWTRGGSLRNIPVGGASRKAFKRSSSSSSLPPPAPITTTSSQSTDHIIPETSNEGLIPGSFTSFLGLGEYGIGPGFGFGPWINSGWVHCGPPSSGCNTWQIDGAGGLVADGGDLRHVVSSVISNSWKAPEASQLDC